MFGHGHCIFYECLMLGTNHLEQTDRNPIVFCPVCYRKLWKCLKFDHVKRYSALVECSKKFGVAFNEPQEYEMNNYSVTEWFEVRRDDLKNKIVPTDYNRKNGQTFLITPNESKRSTRPSSMTRPQSRSSSLIKAGVESLATPKKTFLRRGDA